MSSPSVGSGIWLGCRTPGLVLDGPLDRHGNNPHKPDSITVKEEEEESGGGWGISDSIAQLLRRGRGKGSGGISGSRAVVAEGEEQEEEWGD